MVYGCWRLDRGKKHEEKEEEEKEEDMEIKSENNLICR
jgi:hypothetical protein